MSLIERGPLIRGPLRIGPLCMYRTVLRSSALEVKLILLSYFLTSFSVCPCFFLFLIPFPYFQFLSFNFLVFAPLHLLSDQEEQTRDMRLGVL